MNRKYSDCLRLNLRVARLALSNRWIGSQEVEQSYDRLSPHYESNWLEHLRPITRELLEQLPVSVCGPVLDLGCGTGETTRWLAERYPEAKILAQDISSGMLEAASRNQSNANVEFARGDMMDFLRNQGEAQAELIVSAWAIGYSHPGRVLKEAARVLRPGGRFAFVVNLMDTLQPVYRAFRQTMQRHPERLQALSRPRFPHSGEQLEQQAQAAGLSPEWHKEGRIVICEGREASLPWLLNTGILAGFDGMLPLQEDQAVASSFKQYLARQEEPLQHHYIMAVLHKHE